MVGEGERLPLRLWLVERPQFQRVRRGGRAQPGGSWAMKPGPFQHWGWLRPGRLRRRRGLGRQRQEEARRRRGLRRAHR